MKWDLEGVVINKKLFPCSATTEVEKSASSSGADESITFTTNEIKPLTSLTFTIEPSQEGSGDPSPDNVRPLVSYTKVTVKQKKSNISVNNDIDFNTTVYGVTGDGVTGEFENKCGIVDLGDLTWTTSGNRAYCSDLAGVIKIPTSPSEVQNSVAEKVKIVNYGASLQANQMTCYSDGRLIAYYNGSTPEGNFCYELATPTELTTDPGTFNTFKGEQTIKLKEKIPFSIKYLMLEGDTCDTAKQFLPLFYNKERRSL